MTRIKINRGRWKREAVIRNILMEDCPDPDCGNTDLFYPEFMPDAHCPDCKTDLLGRDLVEGHGKRIAYHLEV